MYVCRLVAAARPHATKATSTTGDTAKVTTTSSASSTTAEGLSNHCLEDDCGGCEPLTHCRPCLKYEKDGADNKVCTPTGYKHKVACHRSKKKMFVSCDPVSEDTRTDTIKFWVFELFAVCGLVIGQIVAMKRQKKHEEKALKRIQKQIEA
jgi:hypothetical protein